MSISAGWPVAARLARREVRRRPWRTVLVGSLVALPVMGMLLAVTWVRTAELSDAEYWRLYFGTADAVLDQENGTFGAVPAGSRTVDVVSFGAIVGTVDDELCDCQLKSIPDDPMTDGMLEVTSGRVPQAPDEVLLSREAARQLGTGLGERVELSRPFGLDATVVGIGYESSWMRGSLVIVGPGAVLPMASGSTLVERFVDLPDDMTDEQRADWELTAGAHMASPQMNGSTSFVSNGDNATRGVAWSWVGGTFGLTVVGIVIAAAFAASARRQLTTLGQLAANGATPTMLRRVLLLQGTVTGLVGSAAGLVLGGLVLVVARPYAPTLLGRAVQGYDIRLLDLVPVVVIAVVAATVAAQVPARGVTRVSVLTALAGRRPLGRVSRRKTVAGLIGAGTGLGFLAVAAIVSRDGGNALAMAMALIAPVLLLLGVCTAAPAYVSLLSPLSARLRGPWRLAGRSLFRQRTRTSALVSAVCAISAVAVAVAAVGRALDADARDDRALYDLADDLVRVRVVEWEQDLLAVVPPDDAADDTIRQAQKVLPNAERFAISRAMEPGDRAELVLAVSDFAPADAATESSEVGQSLDQMIVVDDAFREVFGLDAAAQRSLDEVGAVLIGSRAGSATVQASAVRLPEPGEPSGEVVTVRSVSLEVAALGPEHAHGLGANGELLVTPQTVRDLGLVSRPGDVVFRSPEPITGDQRDKLERIELLLRADRWAPEGAVEPVGGPSVWLEMRSPAGYASPALIEAAPAGVALLFALFVVAAGLALGAAETRDEHDVLAVVGASPSTTRRAGGCKAFLLTLLGGAIAVPVGLLPLRVISRLDPEALPFVVPWLTIALLLVAIPLLVAAVASVASRLSLRWRPVRISTASFD